MMSVRMTASFEEGQLERPNWAGETNLSRLVAALIGFKPLYSLLKLGARQVLISTAEKNNVRWRDMTKEILESDVYDEMGSVQNTSIVYPDCKFLSHSLSFVIGKNTKGGEETFVKLKQNLKTIKGVMWRPDKSILPLIILGCFILYHILADIQDEVQAVFLQPRKKQFKEAIKSLIFSTLLYYFSMVNIVLVKQTPLDYLNPFHAYDEGNLSWLAAAEAEAATMSISKRAIPDASTVAEANEIVRGNWLNVIELHHQQYSGSLKIRDILDIGCSVGVSTRYLADKFPSAKLTVSTKHSVVPEIANQYGNGNVVTAPAEGNGNGINGNPISRNSCRLLKRKKQGSKALKRDGNFIGCCRFMKKLRSKSKLHFRGYIAASILIWNSSDNAPVYDSDGSTEENPSRPVLIRNQLRTNVEMCIYTLNVSIMEQRNVKKTMTDPAWIESIQEELFQFKRLDVWVLVPPSDNIKPLTLKWLFKNKIDEENTVIRNKTRLVMRGYHQEEGIDFE
ncbi:gag-pol polyprotein [Tanacetum coccineum]